MKNIIFLHGALGTADQFKELSLLLKDELNIYCPNLPGHGGSPFTGKDYTIPTLAASLYQYIMENKIRSSLIFGYSMGGYLGLWFASKHPELISGVITHATKYDWTRVTAEQEIKMLDPEIMELKVPAFARELASRHHPLDWKDVVRNCASLIKDLGNENLLSEAVLRTITLPVLVCVGDRDKMVSIEETIRIYRELPNGSLMILPDTPHPFEKTNQTLLATLIQQSVKTK